MYTIAEFVTVDLWKTLHDSIFAACTKLFEEDLHPDNPEPAYTSRRGAALYPAIERYLVGAGYNIAFDDWFEYISGSATENPRLCRYLQQSCADNAIPIAMTCIAQQPTTLAIEDAKKIADVLVGFRDPDAHEGPSLQWLAGHFDGIFCLGTAMGVARVPVDAETWKKTRQRVLMAEWRNAKSIVQRAFPTLTEDHAQYWRGLRQLSYRPTGDVVQRLRALTQAQLGKLLVMLFELQTVPRNERDSEFDAHLRVQLTIVESE